ncbi:MAG: hypothetical protein J6Q36_06330 [Alistipes sp.]|nr:hypothetical protein [Alistipes sp.]
MTEDIKLLSVEDLDNFEKQFHSREIENYMAAVSEISHSNSSEVFSNSGNVHAAIIFSHIFSKSKSIVRILAGNMYNVVTLSNVYQDALLAFLGRKDTRLHILLNSDQLEEIKKTAIQDSIFKKLQPYASKITIRKTKKELKRDGKMIHLCIGDQSMYRLETDPEHRHAEVCLNDADYINKYLIPAYEKLFSLDEGAIECQCETIYN